MPLTAITETNKRVYAPEITKRNQMFICPFCKGEMSFVNATLRIKHFRHKVKIDCPYEPESIEHEETKYKIFRELERLNIGNASIEYQTGNFIADIYLQREDNFDIAFEIQATNYSFEKYVQKITYYTLKHILVVYIFVGDKFCYEVKPNIFSLKEIEKRIFVENSYKNSVIGCYFSNDKIFIPSFTEKFAKGGDGYCENRFIMQYNLNKRLSLRKFSIYLNQYKILNYHTPECNHANTNYEKSQGKIVRYKEVCELCGKFIKWLPNKQVKALGLEL